MLCVTHNYTQRENNIADKFMKKSQRTLFALGVFAAWSVLGGFLYAVQKSPGTQNTQNRFISAGKGIQLVDSTGNVIMEIPLHNERKNRIDKSWDGKRDVPMVIFIVGKGIISGNGKFVAVVRSTYVHIDKTEVGESYDATLQYFGNDGKMLWQKSNVDTEKDIFVSTDGKRIVFIDVKYDFKVSVPAKYMSFVVGNSNGKEIIRMGPYLDGIYDYHITKSGYYGYFSGYPGFVCFNSRSGQTKILKRAEVPDGWLLVSDDGQFRVIRNRKIDLNGKILEPGEVINEFTID